MKEIPRYRPVGRGETVPDKYGDYCKYEEVEHWIGMYSLCNEREQKLSSEQDRLRDQCVEYLALIESFESNYNTLQTKCDRLREALRAMMDDFEKWPGDISRAVWNQAFDALQEAGDE